VIDYAYGRQAMKDVVEANSERKKKSAKALICNRVDEICATIQCPHKVSHKYESDCKNHCCQRDNKQKIVDCMEIIE
jgi:hypothetical protein